MNNLIKNSLKYISFPIILFSSTFFTIKLIESGYNKALTLMSMSLIVFVIMYTLERIIPYQEKWNNDPEVFKDIFHNFFGTYLGAAIGNIIVINFFGNIGMWITRVTEYSLWPSQLPILFQVALIFLISDLGRYIQHRLHHTVPFFWKFHELHHDCPTLNVFKAGRNHIVERIFQQLFMYSLLYFLGVPENIFIYFLIPNSFLGIFVHSNTDLRIGPFEKIIMGPNAHKIHHSLDSHEGNSNFGSALVIWDLIFKTYISPKKYIMNNKKIEVGVKKRNIPDGNVITQALYPFSLKK